MITKPPPGSSPQPSHYFAGGQWNQSANTVAQAMTNARGLQELFLFNEGAGIGVRSAINPWHGGTFVNAPTWGKGAFGGPALNFASNAHVNIGLTPNRTTTIAGTVIAWVKPTSFASEGCIISNERSGTLLWTFNITSTGIRCQYYAPAASNDVIASNTTTPVLNRWHQCVVTSTGSAWAFYINGVPQALTTAAGSNTGKWFNIYNSDPTRIGYDGSYYPLTGAIDHIRIYSHVLTQAMIQRLYESPFDDFEEDGDTDLTDQLFASAGGSSFGTLKTANTIARADLKTMNAIAVANLKAANGLTLST